MSWSGPHQGQEAHVQRYRLGEAEALTLMILSQRQLLFFAGCHSVGFRFLADVGRVVCDFFI